MLVSKYRSAVPPPTTSQLAAGVGRLALAVRFLRAPSESARATQTGATRGQGHRQRAVLQILLPTAQATT